MRRNGKNGMKYLSSTIVLLLLCGCTHLATPHRVGDRVELVRDVYLTVGRRDRAFPEVTVNIKTKNKEVWEWFPVVVSEDNIGKSFLGENIVGVLKAGTVLRIEKFELTDAVDYIYNPIFMKNVNTGAMYDLSNSRLVDSYDTADGLLYSLSPLVFKPLGEQVVRTGIGSVR